MEQFRICKDCDFPGVYAIVNIDKQRVYIGSTKNILHRLKTHKSQLKHGKSIIKQMQKDYDCGDNFAAYVVTPVRIREEGYSKYSDLRYFENIAITEFNACDPEHGYNKKDTEKSSLREQNHIKYSAKSLKFYFSSYNPGEWDRKYRSKNDEEFIENMLNEKGRF